MLCHNVLYLFLHELNNDISPKELHQKVSGLTGLINMASRGLCWPFDLG